MKSRKSPRAIAAQIITAVSHHGASLPKQIQHDTQLLTDQDRALCQAIAYGVLRHYEYYTDLLNHFLRRPLAKKEAELFNLLLVGMYQLLDSRIPAHAAIFETVQAAAILKKSWAKGLINAICQNIQRHLNTNQTLPLLKSQHHHLPPWLLQQIQTAYPEYWRAICQQMIQPPVMTLRVNLQKITRPDYLQQLKKHQLLGQACPFADSAVTLQTPIPVQAIPGFSDGLVSIQDQAGQLLPGLLKLSDRLKILDACAAPGSKTCHILESCHVNLYALDIDPERLLKLQDNLDRLQLHATVQQGDTTQSQPDFSAELFDRIIIDAPCSATGIIRRHPDIKRLRKPEDIEPLTKQQSALLIANWPYLKPGGRLVYSTCSLLPQENEHVIEQFVASSNHCIHCPIDADWGIAKAFGRQIVPSAHNMDGFYFAVLEKAT